MTGETKDEILHEARLRSDTMELTVQLLNAFGEYLSADVNSPVEDQAEARVDAMCTDLMTGKKKAMGGHVLLALCALVCDAGDHEKVQNFLNEQTDRIQEMVDKANGQQGD